MAEEIVRVLRFDTGESVKSLADLKEYIKQNKEALDALEIGTEEYNAQLRKVQEGQDALRDSMNYGQKTITAAKGSYNDLVHTMRELKQAWRATTDETERNKLGKQINVINSDLKQLDASVGVYGRNVGDYANKIQEAFAATGGGASKAMSGIKGMTSGLKAMSATPAIAILGLLANIIDRLIKTLKGTEDGVEGLTSAMGILGGVGEAVTKVMQGFANGLAKVVGWLSKQADALGLVTDRMKEKQKLAQAEIDLARAQREAVVQDAEAERDIAELREKSVDKEKYNSKERMQFLEEANRKEEEIAQRRKANAEEELRIFKEQHKETLNSKEEKDREAQLTANVIKADTELAVKKRANYKERARIMKEEASAAKAAASEAARAAKERTKAEQDALNARLSAEKDYLSQELSLLAAGTQERLDKQLELRAKEYEIATTAAAQKIKDKAELDKQLTLLEAIYEKDVLKLTRDFERAQVEEERKGYDNRMKALTAGTAEYLAAAVELRRFELESLAKADNESEAAFEGRRIAAEKALNDAMRAQADQALNEEHLARENRLLALKEGSAEYLAEAVALKQYELDTLHQLEGESNEAFRQRELEASRALAAAKKAMLDNQVNSWRGYAGVVSGLATSLADAYEGMSADQEKAAEHTKALRIGAGIIDTISAAIAAYRSGVDSGVPAPYNLILAAAQAATVTATGLANVAKIRSTSTKGSGGGASAVAAQVSAPAVVQQVPVTRSLTSQTEEARLDRMASDQRVVLVYTDVEKAQRYVDVVESETSF